MNKKISLALGALILLGSIFYFFNNEKENKVLVNTKTETSPSKEKVEKTEKEILKTEVKKVEDNSSGKIIYKNTSENEDYNMELKVPEQWAHLDYSRLGNPKEVELPKEQWAAGDKLYSKDDPRYYDDGKRYFSAEAEKILLDIFQDREALRYIIDDDEKSNELFEEYFNDINKLIYVDEETGRKEFVKNEHSGQEYNNLINKLKYYADVDETFTFDNWSNKIDYEDSFNPKNKLFAKKHKVLDIDYSISMMFEYEHINKSLDLKENKERYIEFCNQNKELDVDKCSDIIDKQLMNKYLNQK